MKVGDRVLILPNNGVEVGYIYGGRTGTVTAIRAGERESVRVAVDTETRYRRREIWWFSEDELEIEGAESESDEGEVHGDG